MAELRTILLSREPLYARAAAHVDTAGLTVAQAAARLAAAVAPVVAKTEPAQRVSAVR
jgi:XRE family aerobic/anaerobic benzoate catabolism transcriptional regulator